MGPVFLSISTLTLAFRVCARAFQDNTSSANSKGNFFIFQAGWANNIGINRAWWYEKYAAVSTGWPEPTNHYLRLMNPLTGIVLCGGQSTRMGEDKCFLKYQDHPQWEHLARLVGGLCSGVVVSCTLGQFSRLSAGIRTMPHPPGLVADLPEFAGHGPMSGLLTAAHRYPDHSFLLVGCDYPLLREDDLRQIIGARRPGKDAVCFSNPQDQMPEPLIAVYEVSSLPIVRRAFQEGEYSLRRVLEQVHSVRVEGADPGRLRSVDTPEAYHRALGSSGLL